MSGSPWLAPTVTDGQRDYDALVIANNCTTVLHGNMLACLQDIPFDTFMATVNRMADLFSYTPLTPLAPACQWGCDPVQPIPVHCAWCICEGSHSVGGDCDNEGTTNVMTDTEFRDCIQSIYLPAGTPVDVAKITALYPNNSAQFKRISAFEGDYLFTGIR
ncbi:hypothetical protein B0H14DRAFT_3477650 [Mycena olivaceomarginata]|nr:hypothetical protein B0H14DRAFT_3477650 [Mycena olivaceomarginata]